MGVEGTASASAIVSAVEEAGYGCSLKGASGQKESVSDAESPGRSRNATPRKRLIASVGFLLVLMYFSMGHMMWGWPLPAWFDGNHIAMGLVQLLLAGIVMVINQKFFHQWLQVCGTVLPNMDTLVALGSMASFVWSVYALFAMTRAQVDGNSDLVMHYMMEFYFRIRRYDPDPDHRWKNAGSPFQGQDHGCLKRSYEACSQDCRCHPKRSGDHCSH